MICRTRKTKHARRWGWGWAVDEGRKPGAEDSTADLQTSRCCGRITVCHLHSVSLEYKESTSTLASCAKISCRADSKLHPDCSGRRHRHSDKSAGRRNVTCRSSKITDIWYPSTFSGETAVDSEVLPSSACRPVYLYHSGISSETCEVDRPTWHQRKRRCQRLTFWPLPAM